MKDSQLSDGAAVCVDCGSPIPPHWPQGLCSRCALEGALHLPEAEEESLTAVKEVKAIRETLPLGDQCLEFPQRRFGDYELLEEVGRGGMGVVYRARQTRLNRTVALKLILSGQFASKQEVLRFREEAEATANLHHPNIVAVHETGEQQGQHYFSMDFVQGRDLAEIVRDGPMPAQQAARYARVIAEAIHYAHQQGILHRDLKPSNILIDEQDRPRITDFGLAKRVRSDLGLTATGQAMGSPSFMPPEQACGKSSQAGPSGDVYGIGAIVYHLLTGRPPFQAETVDEVLEQLRQVDPVSPRLLNPSIPRDLETLCLKCLDKDPAKRYSTAQALADELGRFLRNEPIEARPVLPPEKIWRWCRRKPVLATLILLVHVVGAVGLGGILWEWHRAERSAAGERQERARAQAHAYASDMNLVAQALEMNNLGRGLALLDRHRPPRPDSAMSPRPWSDLRGWEWRHLWSRCRSDELTTLGWHDHSVSSVLFSPSSKLLLSAGFDGRVKLWDPEEWALTGEIGLGDPVRALALSEDGQWLAALCLHRGCRVWDVAQRREYADFRVAAGDFGGAVAFAPRDGPLATSAGHGEIQLWDLRTKSLVGTLAGHQLEVKQLVFSHDGQTLYSAADDRTVRIWDVASRRELACLIGHERWVSSVALAPDESVLVSGSADGTARVWDLGTRHEIMRLTNHASLVWDVKFAPDGLRLATCGADQRIRLWDTATWQETQVLQGHLNEIWTLAFSPDGKTLASSGKDDSVKLWSALPRRRPPRERLLTPSTQFGSFAPDGLRFSLVESNRVTLWDTRTLSQTGVVSLPTVAPTVGQLGLGGKHLYFGFSSGEIRVVDIVSGLDRELSREHTGEVTTLAVSRDGRHLASAGLDHQVLVQDTLTGQCIARFTIPGDHVQTLCFSRAGSMLAGSVSPEDQIVVWHLANPPQRWILSGHRGLIAGLSFSPDGRLLASASWDATVRLWDLASGRLQASLRGHLLGVNGVDFTPDGRRLVGGTGDGLVKLWDVENHQEVLTIQGKGSMGAVCFLAEDEALVTTSTSAVQLWSAPSLEDIARTERTNPHRGEPNRLEVPAFNSH